MWAAKLLTKINMVLKKIEEIILFIGVSMLSVILITNVIARKAGKTMYFIDEIATFLVICITFAGISYASRKGRHIRMGAIFDLSPVRVQKIMIFVSSTIGAVVMFYVAYISANYVYKSYCWNTMTPALRIPYWIFIIIVPVGFFLTGINYVLTIVKNIQTKEEDIWVSVEEKSEYQ